SSRGWSSNHPRRHHDHRHPPGAGPRAAAVGRLPADRSRDSSEGHGDTMSKTYSTGIIDMSVIANRLDGIVREMENTLLRAGRSAVLNMARDFSCSIITGDNRLLATA